MTYCFKNFRTGPGIVVYFCNPNYLGGRDLEDCGSRLAPSKNHKTLFEKWLNQKGLGMRLSNSRVPP
jgi:hypothetical protein